MYEQPIVGENSKKAEKMLPSELVAIDALRFDAKHVPATVADKRIISEPEKTHYRVEVAGQYHHFVESAIQAYQKSDSHFEERLSMAEASYGDRSAELYQALLADALLDSQDTESKAKRLKALGFSLLKHGYTEQGKRIIEYYLDVNHQSLSSEELGSLAQKLVEYDMQAAISKIIDIVEDRVANRSNLLDVLIKAYRTFGSFSDTAIQDLREHFDGHELNTNSMHTFVLHLAKNGGFKAARGKESIALNKPLGDQYETRYYENRANLAQVAAKFSGLAKLLDTQSDLHRRSYELADALFRDSAAAAHSMYGKKLEEWSREFEIPVNQQEDGAISRFVRELEYSPRAYNDFAYSSDLRSDVIKVANYLAIDQYFFEQAVDLLDKQEGCFEVVRVFENIAQEQRDVLSPEHIARLLEVWNRSLLQACDDLKSVDFIEDHTYASGVSRQRTFTYDNGIRPEKSTDVHFYQVQRLAMAKMLLASEDAAQRQAGCEILESIPANETHFFNPHSFVSPIDSFFSKPNGQFVHTIHQFDQREFKIHALVEGAKLDSDNSVIWLEQALELLGQIDSIPDTSEKFYRFENMLSRYYDVFDCLLEQGRLDEAATLYRKMQKMASSAVLIWTNKVNLIESLPQKDQMNLPRLASLFATNQNLKTARFWEQDIYSRSRAKLSSALATHGEFDEALAIAQDLSASFDTEVAGRRDRFDVRSMAISARQFADSAGLEDYGLACFEMTISKLSLTRGYDAVFQNDLQLLFENIDQSKLSLEARDTLLSQLLQQMSPGKNIEWGEMQNSIPSLLLVAKAISESGKYPKADLEAIKVIHSVAMEASYTRDGDMSNAAKLHALQNLYGFISENYPEIFVFGDALAGVSDDSEYRSFLLRLHPELSEKIFAGSLVEDGFFNLEKIKNGLYDRAELYKLLEIEINQMVASPQLAHERGEHVMQVYQLAIQQDLVSFRNQKDRYYKTTLADLYQIRGIEFLRATFEQASFIEQEVNEFDFRAIRLLLHAQDTEEAIGKKPLYMHILGAAERTIEVQKMAFEGLIKANVFSEYLTNFYEESVLSLEEEDQRLFFVLIKGLLSHKTTMPSDEILVQLLEYTSNADDFLTTYYEAHEKQLIPKKHPGVDNGSRLGIYFNGSKNEYLERREKIAQLQESWIPSLYSFDDLVIVYDLQFCSELSFVKFIETIREIYLFDSFDVTGPTDHKFTRTAQQVMNIVQRVVPHCNYSQAELDKIEYIFEENKNTFRDSAAVLAIPSDRGDISYRELIDQVFPTLELTASQEDDLIELLNLNNDDSLSELIYRTFGPASLTEEQKKALNNALNIAKATHIEQMDKTTQIRVETPPVFDEMPEVVQFALKRFFIQLPYGERQAVMGELDASSEGMTPQVAIRRLFEVTGSEKIGQFLSTRRDLIPEDYRQELERFQEDVEPSAFDEVKSTIETELGQNLDTVFLEFSTKPINVGTVGEVYEARLANGERVAVKVITPSKRRMINLMLKRLEKVCRDMEQNKSRFPGAYDPMAMFNEFKRTMNIETDFRLEHRSAESIRQHLSKGVTIPQYYPEMVTESVLVQSFVEGVHIDLIDKPKIKMKALDKLGAMFFDQLLETGEFHDDLHPGNVRIIPRNGDVEVLDFGRVGKLTDKEKKLLLPLIMALRNGQADTFVQSIETVSTPASNFNKIGLVKAVQNVITDGDGNMSVMISQLFLECGKHGLEVNSSYLQVLKAVMTFEGTARQLDPNFDFEKFIFKLGRSRITRKIGSMWGR